MVYEDGFCQAAAFASALSVLHCSRVSPFCAVAVDAGARAFVFANICTTTSFRQLNGSICWPQIMMLRCMTEFLPQCDCSQRFTGELVRADDAFSGRCLSNTIRKSKEFTKCPKNTKEGKSSPRGHAFHVFQMTVASSDEIATGFPNPVLGERLDSPVGSDSTHEEPHRVIETQCSQSTSAVERPASSGLHPQYKAYSVMIDSI